MSFIACYNTPEFPLAFPIVAALFITAKQTRDPPKDPQIKERITEEAVFTQQNNVAKEGSLSYHTEKQTPHSEY